MRIVAESAETVKPSQDAGRHQEAHRLLSLGFKLCELLPLSKRPAGDGWQLNPITSVRADASGYGVLLAVNGLASIDPDQVDRAREGLKRCGFDLDELMDAGVRTTSTRPGSGGRSTFRAPPELGRIVFRSKTAGTLLELRAGQSNLQDCLPGTVYLGKKGDGPYSQAYAGGRRLDEAPELPAAFQAWWVRLCQDLEFRRQQEALFCGAEDARLSISAAANGSVKLAYPSSWRVAFNQGHQVERILGRHHYVSEDGGERWAPPTATGAPCVRRIPGRSELWQSDHGSDPLLGTFDAWTAHVVLDHDGDLQAAEAAFRVEDLATNAADFQPIESAAPAERRRPVPLDWAALPEDPPEPEFVIPGWLPVNVVTLLAAHGGTGKSFLSLYIALCLATGRHPFIEGAAVPRTKVLLYSAEDGMAVMQWRLARYMRLLGLQPRELEGWLLVLDATEADNVLFVGDERRPEGRTTETFEWLKRQVNDAGAKVLIFDNSSDALDASENDRAKVRQFMSALKRLAPTVLLLAHVDAISSMADPSDAKGYSGSTAWHNSARSRWFMAKAKDSDDIVLALPKVNYAKAGSEVLIRWSEAERVFRVVSARDGRVKASDNRLILLDLLRQVTEEMGETVSPSVNTGHSAYNQMKDMPAFPTGLKSQDVAREVAVWRAEHLVRVEEFKDNNRKDRKRLILTDLGRQVLESASAGAAGLL